MTALSIVAITAAQSTFMYTRSYWLQYLAERVAYDIRNDMYTHLEGLSFSYYDGAQSGQLLARATLWGIIVTRSELPFTLFGNRKESLTTAKETPAETR